MRLFVSYARVDKPYCIQIIEMLDVHEVWYDQRLYAGQQWWKEILRRLDWCEGFIYLLSPESVASEYCRREFELALNLGRHIFPVLIHPDGSEEEIPSKKVLTIRPGDVMRVWTSGGGGYGDPLERPAEDVHADVLDGRVSVEGAARDYGVVDSGRRMEPLRVSLPAHAAARSGSGSHADHLAYRQGTSPVAA